MNDGTTVEMIKERAREFCSMSAIGVALSVACRAALQVVRPLQLMVAGRLFEQRLRVRRRIVRRRRIDSDDLLVRVRDIVRAKAEACDTVGIDADQMQSVP